MKTCYCDWEQNKACNWKGDLTLGHLTPANNASITGLWEWMQNTEHYSKLNFKMPTLKDKFIQDYENMNGRAKYIVVAIKGIDGEIDVHIYAYEIKDKFKHYFDFYNDNFEKISNIMVRVVGYMIV